jgi:hypothetical protein
VRGRLKRAPEAPGFDAGGSADAVFSRDGASDATTSHGKLLLRGARLPGGAPVDVEIRDGRITAVRAAANDLLSSWPPSATLDLTGRWIAPAFIDSHVHLSYWPVGPALLRAGVVAAVDLAAPESALARPTMPLRVIGSGPMITTTGGYPLDSWGSDGYGVATDTAEQAIAAVDRLVGAGASLIKLPLGAGATAAGAGRPGRHHAGA